MGLAVLLLSGCDASAPRSRAIKDGSQAALSPVLCKAFCLPYGWSFKLETFASREHGCTCHEQAVAP